MGLRGHAIKLWVGATKLWVTGGKYTTKLWVSAKLAAKIMGSVEVCIARVIDKSRELLVPDSLVEIVFVDRCLKLWKLLRSYERNKNPISMLPKTRNYEMQTYTLKTLAVCDKRNRSPRVMYFKILVAISELEILHSVTIFLKRI